MTPAQALDHYKTQAEIARVLGCTQPSVAEWFDNEKIPHGRQYQLQIASGGALQADQPANRKEAPDTPAARP